MSEQPDEVSFASRATADLEQLAKVLLERQSALRSVIIVADWDLPAGAQDQLPVCVLRTRKGSFSNVDLERLLQRTVRTLGFLCEQAARWGRAVMNQAQQTPAGAPPAGAAPVAASTVPPEVDKPPA